MTTIARRLRPLKVKFILPALTEATDPYWRPIKYSLFPPLGLATLAAYLSPDDCAVIVDEHVEPLTLDDAPELVVIQAYITNAYRAYRIADHYRSQGAFVCLGGAARHFPSRRGSRSCRRHFSGTRRTDVSEIPARLSRGHTGAGLRFDRRPDSRARPANSSRLDPTYLLSGTEFHRRNPGMSAAL
jgi:hypothetical protein